MKTTLQEFFEISLKTTGAYVKAQLIMLLITLTILSIGFALLEIKLWFLWAFLLTLMDIIPIVGTGLFIIPWAIICFFTDNQALGGWLLALYCALVVIRQIVEPLVVGKKIGLRPIITLGATLLGASLFGPLGLIFAPIVAAIIKAISDNEKRHQANENNQNNGQ